MNYVTSSMECSSEVVGSHAHIKEVAGPNMNQNGG